MSTWGQARWRALGTTAEVLVTRVEALEDAQLAVASTLAAVDVACSRFREDSELSRLNAGAGGPVPISPLLFDALEVALRAAALTGGLVDPTIGQALILAGYDRDFSPAMPARTAPLARVPGWRTVSLDRDHGTATLPPGVRLDLGATAKALAADRAAAAAADACQAGVLVSLGGDIAIAGPAPHNGWTVHVTDDHADATAPGQTVSIVSGGLATSSTTVRRWGPGSHHLVDPETGRPAESPWRTASVAAACCVDANIASTAAILLGASAPAGLRDRGLPARLVAQDGAVEAVGAWPVAPPAAAVAA